MEQNSNDTPKGNHPRKSIQLRFLQVWLDFMKGRFDLRTDSALQADVVESVRKGIDYKGPNLWILIFAIFIASLGLNVNSTAVIIGAMLISPLMGPIIGIGLAFGINDFDMLKRSWRNFMLMFAVSLITSTVYFLISPISTAQSELLARTMPTTYDVLIALFGGLAGMVAQTRKDKTFTVVSGVAIATALMPPLCTAGFGLANGNLAYFIGALYLFTINAVFIALATYAVVLLLQYDKVAVLDPVRQKKNNRYVAIVIAIVTIPSIILGYRIIRRTNFDDNADRYVNQVFQFNKTMVVDYTKSYHFKGRESKIEVKLVGEPLSTDAIDNARAQLSSFGLSSTELVIKQADSSDKIDVSNLQKSYAQIIDEKNARISELTSKLRSLSTIDTLAVADISREVAVVVPNIGSISLTKNVGYRNGKPVDTIVLAIVKPLEASEPIDLQKLKLWLAVRTKNNKIQVIEE